MHVPSFVRVGCLPMLSMGRKHKNKLNQTTTSTFFIRICIGTMCLGTAVSHLIYIPFISSVLILIRAKTDASKVDATQCINKRVVA